MLGLPSDWGYGAARCAEPKPALCPSPGFRGAGETAGLCTTPNPSQPYVPPPGCPLLAARRC